VKAVNVHKAKTNFSKLLAQVESDAAEYVICRNGKPIANLIPHRQKDRLRPHPLLRKIQINYDPLEPLALDEWKAESG
jgi:prevent-host-death family protein